MKNSTYRDNLLTQAQAVVDGKKAGNKEFALTALLLADYAKSRDVIMGTTTTDSELNAEIVKACSMGGYVAYMATV